MYTIAQHRHCRRSMCRAGKMTAFGLVIIVITLILTGCVPGGTNSCHFTAPDGGQSAIVGYGEACRRA